METFRADQQITIVREFDAPRELVWRMWTEPEHFGQWFGHPLKTPVATIKMDVKVGGKWEATMDSGKPGGYPFKGTYREINPPERLVFTFEDSGNVEIVTVQLKDKAGKTEMIFNQAGGNLPPEEYEIGLKKGYNSFFDGMEEHLKLIQK